MSLFPQSQRWPFDVATQRSIEAALVPLLEAGALGPLGARSAVRLASLSRESRPEVVLGLALALSAPQAGHVCVDLASLRPEQVLPEPAEGVDEGLQAAAVRACWPSDGGAWLRAMASSPLCRTAPEPPLLDAPTTPLVLDAGLLYADRWWRYQRRLAVHLLERVTQAVLPEDPDGVAAALDLLFRPPAGAPEPPGLNRQRLAGALSQVQRLTVISGGPGMGKTWTVRNVLSLLWLSAGGHRGALRIALAAPTGKAAARMKESLRDGLNADFIQRMDALGGDGTGRDLREDLLAVEPQTLHRLLGPRPDAPSRFRRDTSNPLSADVVVVDEASMVDLALMAKLVAAVPTEARLVLLGDRNQLASVAAGTVLADLCGPASTGALRLPANTRAAVASLGLGVDDVDTQSGAPLRSAVVQLNRTFRFADDSGIGAFAAACLHQPFDAERAADLLEEGRDDACLLPWTDRTRLSPDLHRLVVEGYTPYLELLKRGYDPVRDLHPDLFFRRVLDAFETFRVLAAHRKGRSGVEGLNQSITKALQEATPWRPQRGARAWLGRPIMVLENAYALNRFNGDVGIGVTTTGRRGDGALQVVFPGPDAAPSVPDPDTVRRLRTGALRVVEHLEVARLPAHQTVYAMTIHKSQGSEFRHAVVVLPERRSPVVTRELLYTGVTRARKQVTVVGARTVLEDALRRPVRRASGLGGLLWPEQR